LMAVGTVTKRRTRPICRLRERAVDEAVGEAVGEHDLAAAAAARHLRSQPMPDKA
jgi:hypothetical protein